MYANGKSSTVPSNAQAREKLALYVYEYLHHVGAQKAARMFLSEIRWDENITLGEPPGFLHSWWCVFWDLYCAAPERRNNFEHSSEAKAFHDYGFVKSGTAHNTEPFPIPMGQIPSNDGMPGGPMPPGFFPNSTMRFPIPVRPVSTYPSSQPTPPRTEMMASQPFMGQRYQAGSRPGVRLPQLGNEYIVPPGQQMMQNSMDPSRQGPTGMVGMNPRMNPPRIAGMSPVGPSSYDSGLRGPPSNVNMGPGDPGVHPISMTRSQWQPNTSTPMNYLSSPGNYFGRPGPSGTPGPGTSIMQSLQDSSNSGGENIYTMLKPVPGGSMPGDILMDDKSEGEPMVPVMLEYGLDSMKNSPVDGPSTPKEDSGSGMGDYNFSGFGRPPENDQTESAAIMKIRESMQEEAKRFEKDSDPPDYFMP